MTESYEHVCPGRQGNIVSAYFMLWLPKAVKYCGTGGISSCLGRFRLLGPPQSAVSLSTLSTKIVAAFRFQSSGHTFLGCPVSFGVLED